ncbi:hypothetical protein SAMN05216249_10382 [Acetitomaculum ruminis DSM 5522]|uniref:Phosphoesterase n=1 Tax=Acetitomaculum ruminis DSM 5522 TaxID=1120918 RepID=A0A1I0W5R3_9FIRM|nr:metallophosphoesterase [Acetitomaculum ruminis]SFA83658.1 hypothetical protein SAMN05216249_10382 [Acetitomaculum ruminis DSM 5522]
MKILVVSDTHGYNDNLKRVLEIEGTIDALFHLGDLEMDAGVIENMAQCPCELIAGNNDLFSVYPREKMVNISSCNIFMTHGHKYYVNTETDFIKKKGISMGADIVMFGHTHVPVVDTDYNITLINPGSLTYPRQKNRLPSYIVMNLSPKGQTEFEIKYLNEKKRKFFFF